MGILNEILNNERVKVAGNVVVISALGVTAYSAGVDAYTTSTRLGELNSAVKAEGNKVRFAVNETPIAKIEGIPDSLRTPKGKEQIDKDAQVELDAQYAQDEMEERFSAVRFELNKKWWLSATLASITGLLAAGIFWTAADKRIRWFFREPLDPQKPIQSIIDEKKTMLTAKNHEIIENKEENSRSFLEKFSDPVVRYFRRDPITISSPDFWNHHTKGLDLNLKPKDKK